MPRVPEPQHGSLLTVDELATFFAVSHTTIRRWCQTGFLPHIPLVKDIRFDPATLQEWLDARTVQARSPEDDDDTNSE